MDDDEARKAEGADWRDRVKEQADELNAQRKASRWWQRWKGLPADARFWLGAAGVILLIWLLLG